MAGGRGAMGVSESTARRWMRCRPLRGPPSGWVSAENMDLDRGRCRFAPSAGAGKWGKHEPDLEARWADKARLQRRVCKLPRFYSLDNGRIPPHPAGMPPFAVGASGCLTSVILQ